VLRPASAAYREGRYNAACAVLPVMKRFSSRRCPSTSRLPPRQRARPLTAQTGWQRQKKKREEAAKKRYTVRGACQRYRSNRAGGQTEMKTARRQVRYAAPQTGVCPVSQESRRETGEQAENAPPWQQADSACCLAVFPEDRAAVTKTTRSSTRRAHRRSRKYSAAGSRSGNTGGSCFLIAAVEGDRSQGGSRQTDRGKCTTWRLF
jgi:hypothetical protein